jgi:hypothetical protein
MIKLKKLIYESVSDNPNFKKWFGNSKVVDSSGNPLVVYHGTNQSINSFSKYRRGASTSSLSSKKAFFFTDSSEVAHQYAQKAGRTVRSNISNFEKKVKLMNKRLEALEKRAQRTGDWAPWEKAMEELEAFDINSVREDEVTGQNIIPVFLKIENPLIKDLSDNNFEELANLPATIDWAKKHGYDGLILKNVDDPLPLSTHFVVFNPNQIKSAIGNIGEFNPRNSDMRKE